MTTNTLIHPFDQVVDDRPRRPAVADWLLAMGPVVHHLDYGGRIAAIGPDDGQATELVRRAYPLAEVEVVAATEVLARRPSAYDLVAFLGGLVPHPEPVAWARAALGALRPAGAVMVVEHGRTDLFGDGPLEVASWLAAAGAARTRLAAAVPHGFVLDSRPT